MGDKIELLSKTVVRVSAKNEENFNLISLSQETIMA